MKAISAYEKGLKKLIARSKPIGYDRNQNAVYFFQHDPDALYIEANTTNNASSSSLHPNSSSMSVQKSTNKSWHVIDSKILFDDFLSSLDSRGIRESKLLDAITSIGGLKRNLFDDCKRRNMLIARKKEEEEYARKLENARIACDTEEAGGRRSGRLASCAHVCICCCLTVTVKREIRR